MPDVRNSHTGDELFRTVFQLAPDGMSISRLDNGLFIDVNKGFSEMFGYAREEVVDRTSYELHFWKDFLDRKMIVERLEAAGQLENFETVIISRYDRQVKVMLSARIIELDGEPCLLISYKDITKYLQTLEALRYNERQYRELSRELQATLDGIPDALVLWSADRRVIWANRNSRNFMQASNEQVIGRSCRDLCQMGHRQEGCLIDVCFSTATNTEDLSKQSDGSTWSVKAFPILSESGGVEKVLLLASNITERLRLREEADRSARLAALGELAAGVAHEINNPNGLILMNMSMVQDIIQDLLPQLRKPVEAPARLRLGGLEYDKALQVMPEIITEVIESGQHIKQIVEDLKDFSNPDSPAAFEPVDLNQVVIKTIKRLQATIDQVTDSFAVSYAEGLPKIMGNARKLEQVVANLILNACQALRERSESLAIAIYHDARTDAVCLKVWDEGVGIDEKMLPQITDPFFTTRRESGGTGLGLSISARIIQEHAGHLHFESTPAYGTLVTLKFPAATPYR